MASKEQRRPQQGQGQAASVDLLGLVIDSHAPPDPVPSAAARNAGCCGGRERTMPRENRVTPCGEIIATAVAWRPGTSFSDDPAIETALGYSRPSFVRACGVQ